MSCSSGHLSPCVSSMCSLHACQFSCLSAHVLASWTVSCPSWCSFLPQAALEHTAPLSVHPPPPKLHSFPSSSVPFSPQRLRSHCHRGLKSTEPVLVSSLSFFIAHTHTAGDGFTQPLFPPSLCLCHTSFHLDSSFK